MYKIDKIFLKAAAHNDHVRVTDALNGDISDFWDGHLGTADVNAVDKEGRNALMLAAMYSHQQMVGFLLARKIKTNTTCDKGRTILHYAVAGKHIDLIDAIIKLKPEYINQPDKFGMTPLHLAISEKISDAAIELMIKNGADIHQVTNKGNSAIHLAVDGGRISTIKLIIAHGADLNKQNNVGNTSLQACWFKHLPEGSSYPTEAIWRLLVEEGASPYIPNNAGNSIHSVGGKNAVRLYEEVLARKEGRVLPPEDTPLTKARRLFSIGGKAQEAPKPQATETLPAEVAPPPIAADQPNDTKLRQAFIDEGLDPAQDEQWRPIGQSVIEHIMGGTDNPRILVTTFNFVSRQCTSTSKNILTGQTNTPSTMGMDQFSNPDYVAEAHAKLVAAGKRPPVLWPNGQQPAPGGKKMLGDKM